MKQNFYEINLKQRINKLTKLWKSLKSMGLQSKATSALKMSLKDKNEIIFNDTFLLHFQKLPFQSCAKVGI